MKFLIAILIFLSVNTLTAQRDSLVCFTKPEAITLANKIRTLQDSLVYKTDIIQRQWQIIKLQDDRSLVYKDQLQNREETIETYKKQSEVLQQAIEDSRPKWYDNKFLWFGGGVAATIITILVVK